MENSHEMPRLQRDIVSEIRLMQPRLHGTGADGSGPLGLLGVSHAARAVDAEDCGVARSRRLSEFAGSKPQQPCRGPRGTLYAVPFRIRPAAVEDADAIGAVHVRSRLAAYRGVMPNEYLDGLRAQDRADGWRWHLTALRPDQKVLVVVDRDRVVGFAIFGCERGSDTSQDVGELYAINLDPEVWDRGIGRALLRRATDEHSAANHPSAGFSHQRDGRGTSRSRVCGSAGRCRAGRRDSRRSARRSPR